MLNYHTADEWEVYVGSQLKAARLRQNVRQEEVADRAGIGIATLSRLEAGRGSSLHTFIKVLKVLKLDDWLETLAPEVSISPLQMQKQSRVRQRARQATTKQKGSPEQGYGTMSDTLHKSQGI